MRGNLSTPVTSNARPRFRASIRASGTREHSQGPSVVQATFGNRPKTPSRFRQFGWTSRWLSRWSRRYASCTSVGADAREPISVRIGTMSTLRMSSCRAYPSADSPNDLVTSSLASRTVAALSASATRCSCRNQESSTRPSAAIVAKSLASRAPQLHRHLNVSHYDPARHAYASFHGNGNFRALKHVRFGAKGEMGPRRGDARCHALGGCRSTVLAVPCRASE